MRFAPLLSVVLIVLSGRVLSAEVTVMCTLDDERSQQFCKRSALASLACQHVYALDDAKQTMREVNPGRVLPDFTIRTWSQTRIEAVRVIDRPEVTEQIETFIDRMGGRLIQTTQYVDKATGKALSGVALDAYETAQVEKLGLFGHLDRQPTTAMCKAAQRAF